MPRSTPPERFEEILRAATREFARKGFRRTQMADVAEQLDLSVGTLYRYVESKEALFFACVAAASPAATRPALEPVVATPPPGALAEVVRDGLAAVNADSPLRAALRTDHPDDVAGELASIIGHMYDRTNRSRRLQALLEAAAPDVPELFDAFFGRLRRPVLRGLTAYLDKRIAGGYLRPVPDVATTARLINETQAWFARHRYADLDARDIDDEVARATVIDMLVAALVPGPA